MLLTPDDRWIPGRDLPQAVRNADTPSIHSSQKLIQPNRAKAIWDFEGINCSSRHIPGVKFAGLIHPGILGCAPSPEILATWNEREGGLIKACAHMDRDVAKPPEPKNVHAGTADDDVKEKVGNEGARTIPGRPEHGGNCDIKNLSRGSKVYLPVHVKGAKFSVGDLHFSQGDGEISFCGAIEMAGVITIKFSVMKGGMEQLAMKSPIYVPGPVEPQFGPGRYIYFEGFSVDEHGKQHYLDATVAYRQTCLRVIEYLRRYGQSLLNVQKRYEHRTDYVRCLQVTTTTRSTSSCHAPRSRATLRVLSTSPMSAPQSACQSTSSTSTSQLKSPPRSATWAAVLLPVPKRKKVTQSAAN
jgi:acetamidase/formamidase